MIPVSIGIVMPRFRTEQAVRFSGNGRWHSASWPLFGLCINENISVNYKSTHYVRHQRHTHHHATDEGTNRAGQNRFAPRCTSAGRVNDKETQKTVEFILNFAAQTFPVSAGLRTGCGAIEIPATLTSRYDAERLGIRGAAHHAKPTC